jgi:hypothetical protein
MNAIDLHADAWEGIRKGYEADRLAHAYVIVGSPRGNALQFAETFLKLLFCDHAEKPCHVCVACRQVAGHKHVDNLWIEPQSKSRQIKADEIRALVHRMTQTSFEGGWKAGIILSADCMTPQAANVLLKTLEEPPPKTLLLLVTHSPQALLPTILSRCHKIVLETDGSDSLDADWRLPLMNVLYDLPPSNGLSAARLASQLNTLFDVIKAGIADLVEEELGQRAEALDETKMKDILAARTHARLKEVQADVCRVILDWHRDVLLLASNITPEHLIFPEELEALAGQAKFQTANSALQAVLTVEAMAQRLSRNIPDLQIFDEAFRQLVRK